MKKLIQLLLALFMTLSLAACSSDSDSDDPSSEPDEEIEWMADLEGNCAYFTITYADEQRDILIQIEDETTMRFYFDQEEEDNYTTITLSSGSMDESGVLSTIRFMDTDSDGYDDITFSFTDQNGHYIDVEYDYDLEYNEYEISTFDTELGVPDEIYQDVWYYNADLTDESFVLDQWGNWAVILSTGEYFEIGYAYQDESGINLYDKNGEYAGDITLDDSDWLIVTLYGGTEEYARQENSSNGQ